MSEGVVAIEFYLEKQTGVAPYMQLVQQVKQALRLGILQPGDQLPTVREVIAQITINPNTVFKAYRELEHDGLVESRPGQGTFVLKSLADPLQEHQDELQGDLLRWLQRAHELGLDDESIKALFTASLHQVQKEATIKQGK